jgi:hypothetical protein
MYKYIHIYTYTYIYIHIYICIDTDVYIYLQLDIVGTVSCVANSRGTSAYGNHNDDGNDDNNDDVKLCLHLRKKHRLGLRKA